MVRFAVYSYERLVAIGLAMVAVISPLYIDRIKTREEVLCVHDFRLASWLPLLLLVLILIIIVCRYFDRSFTRFDPYWIHRVGGSSAGIIVILVLLALILKYKSSLRIWKA